MTNDLYIRRLRSDVNDWNLHVAELEPGADFSSVDLSGETFYGAVLMELNFSGANFSNAGVARADFTQSNLRGANFDEAELTNANFTQADLTNAKLTNSELMGVIFRGSILKGADFSGSILIDTVFSDVDLSGVIGLERCEHWGPSVVDPRSFRRSGRLPLPFLRGIGLPDSLIEYLPSLTEEAIQRYSCFISYSHKDRDFAERLFSDLQNNGVRCWFAPHNLPIGGKILDEIDVAIRLRDKLLLVLSENSIESEWVEDEVSKAFEEERKRGGAVLFPIRLDDSVMNTAEPWAAKLRAQRHIGDFRNWKYFDHYKDGFERVLRDLTVKTR